MKEFLGGSVLNVVEKHMNAGGNIKELAINFLLYGALAEIFARTTGFNRGLGGSMHAFSSRSDLCRTMLSSVLQLL